MTLICSQCGGEVVARALLAEPPIFEWKCSKCGSVRQECPGFNPNPPIVIDMPKVERK